MIDLDIADPLILPLVPAAARPGVLALWQVDARLAEVARTGREAALRQIRMRWWAEAIAGLASGGAPAGEPLLGALSVAAPGLLHDARLIDWTDAWEVLTADPASDAAVRSRGRALFGLTARLLGMTSPPPAVGQAWSLTERAIASDDGTIRTALFNAARAIPPAKRAPKSLAALDALARVRARHDGVVHPRREQLVVLRAGLLGW